MPLCTNCAQPTPYLYTIYQTAHNFRLEQCPSCQELADPYVQRDNLTLILDLILLKRDVYRHLLFNQGTGARLVIEKPVGDDEDVKGLKKSPGNETQEARWLHILRLEFVLVWADAFIRWTHLNHDSNILQFNENGFTWSRVDLQLCLRVLIGCCIETIAFHAAATAACYVLVRALDIIRSRRKLPPPATGIRQMFRLSNVPLTILYSSLTKFLLLFLLSIWKPSTTPSTSVSSGSVFDHPMIIKALEIFDDDKLDKEWVVRNVLGGMAAGFGLRVILDCHPIFTTLVILFGWAVKTSVSRCVSDWVGGGERIGDIWLAYSIP